MINLEIDLDTRKFQFRTPNKVEGYKWIEAITHAINTHKSSKASITKKPRNSKRLEHIFVYEGLEALRSVCEKEIDQRVIFCVEKEYINLFVKILKVSALII